MRNASTMIFSFFSHKLLLQRSSLLPAKRKLRMSKTPPDSSSREKLVMKLT